LLEALGEAVTIRAPDNTIIYANAAARAGMGFITVEDLRNRSPRAVMEEYIVTDEQGEPLDMDDLPSVRLLRGEPAPPLLLHSISRATGEVAWRLLKATALRDAHGEIVAAVTVIEDMTAVKQAEQRARVLAESGRLLVSSLDYEQTLQNVAEVAVPALADWCVVDLIGDDLRRQTMATAHRDPAKRGLARRLREMEPDELDPGRALTRVLQSGVPELYSHLSDEQLAEAATSEEELELLRALELRSVAIVPMRVPQRILGVMTLVTAESMRTLTAEDLDVAEQLGRRAALAVENARLHTALADVASTLQRDLLPDELPDVPGWDLAALYKPAGASMRVDVGGDFYEVFATDAGWTALIGDVTGKGVRAAAMTALMRHGARFASRLEPEPAAILARLNEFLRQRAGDAMCTALCVQFRADHVVASSAGHPPALIVARDREIREEPATGPLLGAFASAVWPEQTIDVSPDELILLYTDGVTETAGRSERFGSERLRALLAKHASATPTALIASLEAALDAFGTEAGRDDIAALALRRRIGA
jgi:PAS domain S-box-containing protein